MIETVLLLVVAFLGVCIGCVFLSIAVWIALEGYRLAVFMRLLK